MWYFPLKVVPKMWYFPLKVVPKMWMCLRWSRDRFLWPFKSDWCVVPVGNCCGGYHLVVFSHKQPMECKVCGRHFCACRLYTCERKLRWVYAQPTAEETWKHGATLYGRRFTEPTLCKNPYISYITLGFVLYPFTLLQSISNVFKMHRKKSFLAKKVSKYHP